MTDHSFSAQILLSAMLACQPAMAFPRTLGESPKPVTAKDDIGLARSLVLEATLSKTKYRQLEPIIVSLKMKNADGKKRAIYLPETSFVLADRKDKLNFVRAKVFFEETGECERTSDQRMRERFVGTASGGQRLLDGETMSGDVIVNIRSDMTRPGKYMVVLEVSLFVLGAWGKPEFATAHSQSLSLEVEQGIDSGKK